MNVLVELIVSIYVRMVLSMVLHIEFIQLFSKYLIDWLIICLIDCNNLHKNVLIVELTIPYK